MQEFYRVKARLWFNFFSMERSGHVAVLNWLMQQFPPPSARVTPPGVPTGIPGAGYHYPGAPLVQGKNVSEVPPRAPIRAAGINFRDSGLFSPKGYPRASQSVILVRDIRNLLASRKQHTRDWDLKETVRTWCHYARTWLGEGDLAPWPLVPIRYDQWFLSETYRRGIVENIGNAFNVPMTFTDAGMNDMQPAGGGSSFDRLKYRGKASEMKVLERYKQVDIMSWVTDEARELDERIHGRWE